MVVPNGVCSCWQKITDGMLTAGCEATVASCLSV